MLLRSSIGGGVESKNSAPAEGFKYQRETVHGPLLREAFVCLYCSLICAFAALLSFDHLARLVNRGIVRLFAHWATYVIKGM